MTTEGGQGGDASFDSRSDLGIVGKALRQDWPIPPTVKQMLLQRAIDICDPDTKVGGKAQPRLVLRALQVIALYQNLVVKQQVVDLARERHELKTKGDGSLKLSELTAEAEQAAREFQEPQRPEPPSEP